MAEQPKWDVVVVGGANTDYTARAGSLPKPGETVQGTTYQRGQGGKGANQAVAAARLGARVAFVGRVGSDERGDAMLKTLQQEGVDTEYTRRDESSPTGVAIVQVDAAGEKQITAVPYANGNVSAADIQDAAPIRQARVVISQLEIPVEAVVAAARLAQSSGAMMLLDPAPPADIPEELFRYLTAIKPNSSEAEALTGVAVADRDSARTAAQKLRGRGVSAVIVQAGHDGNLLVWKEDEVWLPKMPVESVDATGAGDALIAALGVALAEGQSWPEAGRFASAAAALTTTDFGAQAALPTRPEVEKLLAQQKKRDS